MDLSVRVALATAVGDVDEDVDLPNMVTALRDRGYKAEPVAWDDCNCDWSTFQIVVIRSTWDYCSRLADFLSWSNRVSRSTLLRNPAEIITWNSDKRYLASLVSQGVPVLQTSFAEPGEPVPLPTQHDFVIKPVISAGARDTARYTQDQIGAALKHAEQLHATGMTVMVQPFLTQISQGERSLVFLDGQFSHAIRKGPVLTKTGIIDNALWPILTRRAMTRRNKNLLSQRKRSQQHRLPKGACYTPELTWRWAQQATRSSWSSS